MLCSLITVGIFHPYIMAALHVGMQVRVACCSLIYRKVKYLFIIHYLIHIFVNALLFNSVKMNVLFIDY